jgi:hypothetical protein
MNHTINGNEKNFDTNSFSIKEIHSDFTEGHTWVN